MVTMRIQASAATGNDRARAACLGQPGQPPLAREDSRVPRDGVECVAKDVEPGRGRAVEGGLERVDLLIAAVGLDNHEA